MRALFLRSLGARRWVVVFLAECAGLMEIRERDVYVGAARRRLSSLSLEISICMR